MMIRNLLASITTASIATMAVAAEGDLNWKIKAKIRADAIQSKKEVKADGQNTVTSHYSEVKLKRAQFEFAGTQGPVKVMIKYYGESNELKNAVISHKTSDMLSLHFGKVDTLYQSWETNYSTSDQYFFSLAGSKYLVNTPGVQVDGNFGDHHVYAQVLQGAATPKGATAVGVSKGDLTTALRYRGDLGMVRPMLTYTTVRLANSRYTDSTGAAHNYGNGYQNHIGAGVQLVPGDATIDLEYDLVKELKEKDSTTSKDHNISSIVAQVKYKVGDAIPMLKVSLDSAKYGKDDNVDDIAGMNVGLGVEYMATPNTRLHAVAINKASSTKVVGSMTDKTTEQEFNFGVTSWL